MQFRENLNRITGQRGKVNTEYRHRAPEYKFPRDSALKRKLRKFAESRSTNYRHGRAVQAVAQSTNQQQ